MFTVLLLLHFNTFSFCRNVVENRDDVTRLLRCVKFSISSATIISPKLFYIIHQVTHFLDNEAKGTNVIGATSMEDMVSKLKLPRRVMMLVKGEFLRIKVRVDVLGVR